MIHKKYKNPKKDISAIFQRLCQKEAEALEERLKLLDDEMESIDEFYNEQEKVTQYDLYQKSQQAVVDQQTAELSEITRARINERFIYEWYYEVKQLVARRNELLLSPGFFYTEFIHYSGKSLQALLFERYEVVLKDITFLIAVFERWDEKERFKEVSDNINGVLLWLENLQHKFIASQKVLFAEIRQRLIFDYGFNNQCEDRLFYLSGYTAVKALELRNKYRKEPVYVSPYKKDIIIEKEVRDNFSNFTRKYTTHDEAILLAKEALSFLPMSIPLSISDFPNEPGFFKKIRKGQSARYNFFSSWEFVETCKLFGSIKPLIEYQSASPHYLLDIYMQSVRCAEGIIPKEIIRTNQINNKLNSIIHKKAKKVFSVWEKYLRDSRITLLKKRIEILKTISYIHAEKLKRDLKLRAKFNLLFDETKQLTENLDDTNSHKAEMLLEIFHTVVSFQDRIDLNDIVVEDKPQPKSSDLVNETVEIANEIKTRLYEVKDSVQSTALLRNENASKLGCSSNQNESNNTSAVVLESAYQYIINEAHDLDHLLSCDEVAFNVYCESLDRLSKDSSDKGINSQYLYVSHYLKLLAKKLECLDLSIIDNNKRYQKINMMISVFPALKLQSAISNYQAVIGALVIRSKFNKHRTLDDLYRNVKLFEDKGKAPVVENDTNDNNKHPAMAG